MLTVAIIIILIFVIVTLMFLVVVCVQKFKGGKKNLDESFEVQEVDVKQALGLSYSEYEKL